MSLGHNQPDQTADIQARLKADYENLNQSLADHITAFLALPMTVVTKEDHDLYVNLVTRIRASYKTAEATRVAEKDPYLKAERAIDGFFEPMKSQLSRLMSGLSQKVEDYLTRKAAEERRAREEAARIEREKAEALRREEAAQRAKQELAERKAIEANRKAARERADAEATSARAAAETAAAEAREAEIQADDKDQIAQARPADLARTRSDRGTLSTLKSVWVGKIEDIELIPLETLRPYISTDVVEKAVNSFVKMGGRQLPGVRIYETEKAVIR